MKKTLLNKIKQYEYIIIYGAGGRGRTVFKWLREHNVSVHCFAVTSLKDNEEMIDNVSVRQVDELLNVRDKAIVIVSVWKKSYGEIEMTLDNYGFKHRLFVTDKMLEALGVDEVNGIFVEKNVKFYKFVNKLARKFFQHLKCRNVVIFETYIDYTDNCRALSEYIERALSKKYKIIWIVKNVEEIPKTADVTCVNRHKVSVGELIRLNYYLSVAKYIFFTHPGWLKNWKTEQTVVTLGHGNPFKKPTNTVFQPSEYVLASGEDGIRFRRKEYSNEVKIVVLGPPRNDWLFIKDDKILKCYTEGKMYKKVILCLPTMKKSAVTYGKYDYIRYDSKEINEFGINTINNREDMQAFNELLCEHDVLFICKEHYLQLKKEQTNLSNVKYVDDATLKQYGHDIYQLMAQVDALITDFSSIFMDFLLLDRPIGFFCDKTKEYVRGFTMDNPLDYMAGEKIYDNKDLHKFIKNVANETDNYIVERKMARDLVFKYQDNQNCKRCVEYFGM